MVRRLWRAWAALLAMSVGVALTPSTVALAGSQAPGAGASVTPFTAGGDGCSGQPRSPDTYPHTIFTGWKRGFSGTVVGGAYSDIWNYSPWVYRLPSGDGFESNVSAWAMLIDGVTEQKYAQTGWIEFPGGVRHTFYQYYTGSGSPQGNLQLSPQTLNTYTYYTTLYNSVPNSFSFKVGSTVVGTVADFFVPYEAQVMTETHDAADQVPGGNSSSFYYEDLFDSHMWYSGSWQPLGLAGVYREADEPWGHIVDWSGSTVKLSTYDTACAT